MGCILYPPVSLVSPFLRLHRRRSPTRTRTQAQTQEPVFTPNCISTSTPRASSWRWRVLLEPISPTTALPTTALQASLTSPIAQQTPTSTTTTTPPTPTKATTDKKTNERTNNNHKSYHRRNNKLMVAMEQRLIALPSIALSIAVLALSAAIGSTCSASDSSSSNAPTTLSSILGRGVGLGLGLNLSTLAPLLTLAWHAFSLLTGSDPYRRLSRSSSIPLGLSVSAGEDNLPPPPPMTATATAKAAVRTWAPHTLVLVWILNTLLLLLVPRWTLSTAFSHTGLVVLSALEAGVLALGGVLARYQLHRVLAGEMDDEYGWENAHVDGDGDDDDDDMKLGEI